MINFLHTYLPSSIIFSLGPLSLRWYGLFMTLSILSALLLSFHIGKKYLNIDRETIFDLAFWLIISGLIGARIYDVFLQLPYYLEHPVQIIQIWKGGLAIHGAIIAGLITIYFFSKKHRIPFFKLSALIAPGLALGQAIGRFGNYFNQELFGLPTNLSWGIPIAPAFRPSNYINENYFHPTFLYESLGSLLIFAALMLIYRYFYKSDKINFYFYTWLTALYMILYSVLRFSLEFIRIDATPELVGLRWPQIISLFIILASLLVIKFHHYFYAQSSK